MNPKITTVIPTYRRPQMLRRAIRSVLAQEYPDFELHVYDNASGDETCDVVAGFATRDSRVIYHCHFDNIGMMPNFAYGIDHVATPLFNILSDDDIVLPGFYRTAVDGLEPHPEAALFIGGLLYANLDSGVVHSSISDWKQLGYLRSRDLFLSLLPGAWITWTSTLFRTECVRRVGGLDVEAGHTGDVDLMLRLAAAHPGVADARPCGVLTIHPSSASTADSAAVLRQQLALKGYRNICAAIRKSLAAGSVSSIEAKQMESQLTRGGIRAFFRSAIIFAAAGDVQLARDAADVLGSEFGRRGLAALVRAYAADSIPGGAARVGVRGLRALRQMRYGRNPSAHASQSEVVGSTIRALESSQ